MSSYENVALREFGGDGGADVGGVVEEERDGRRVDYG